VFVRGTDISFNRSSFCINGTCILIGFNQGHVILRDSKQDHLGENQPEIRLPDTEFAGFVALLDGRATHPEPVGLTVEHDPNGGVIIRSDHDGVALVFDGDERSAFLAGVDNGEFLVPA
jgi:hypothetical protein